MLDFTKLLIKKQNQQNYKFPRKIFSSSGFSKRSENKSFQKTFFDFCLGNRLTSLGYWQNLSFFTTRNFALITFGAIPDIKRYKTDGRNSVNFIPVYALPKLNISEAFT